MRFWDPLRLVLHRIVTGLLHEAVGWWFTLTPLVNKQTQENHRCSRQHLRNPLVVFQYTPGNGNDNNLILSVS